MSGAFPVLDIQSGWRLAPDPQPPAAACVQQVLVMQLVDEINGQPPDPPPAAATTTSGLTARADANGLAGLVGTPLALFPTALSSGATLQLTLDGPLYVQMTLATTLILPADYPDSFIAANLDQIALHRAPVTIVGRVVDSSGTGLAGADVAITGLWPTVASLHNATPAPANLVALLSPLYAARDVTATVAAASLTAAAPVKTLVKPGNVGDVSLRLSDQLGLAVGDVLALDQQDLARGEYVSIAAITDGGVTPQGAVTVSLALPLARLHAAGAAAAPMTATVAGPATGLARAAQVGDVTLFPAAMAGLGAATAAVIVSGGGPAPDELHAASLYSASSDSAGHFVLPPLHRLAQVQLLAHHPPQTDLQSAVILPLGAATLKLNLAMT